jgi:hypothetical protein
MDGLEAVADIGEGAGGDGGQRVGEVALGEGLGEGGVAGVAAGNRGEVVGR